MVLHVPFSPPETAPITGHFCGRVLRESTDPANAAIVIWKFWVALSPVEDRLTGRFERADGVRKRMPRSRV